MKLSYILNGDELVCDAYQALDEAQELANERQYAVEVYNWSPGQHKHGSLYLVKYPDAIDTPMAEMYGG